MAARPLRYVSHRRPRVRSRPRAEACVVSAGPVRLDEQLVAELPQIPAFGMI